MHRFLTTIALIAATMLPSFAIQEINEGDVLNLDKCIEIALRNSPYISKAKANIRYSKANLGQSKSAWVPSISAGTGFSGSHSRIGHRNSDNNYFMADAMISQLIYDFGKTNANIGIQKFNTLASEYELEQVTLETILAVKEAYFNVLAAKANKDIQVQNVEINERQYDMIKSYYDEGIRSRIDFVNADVNLSNAKIDMLSAQDRYCDAMVQLNQSLYITNNPDYSIVPIEQFNTDEMTPVTHIHSHTTAHNHEKLQENEEKEITLEGIIRENEIVKDHKLNIFANGGYTYRRNDGTNTNSFSYGADLSFPMINPLSIKYQIDAANAQLDSANEDIRLIYQNIYYDIQQALCETKILENQIPLVFNRINQAKENFELANGRYLEGIGNYIELQDARSAYLNAQQEYINTVYQYNLARANLEFVMGVK